MNIERWITVHPHGKETKGNPIPVGKGESNKQAVESFFDKRKKLEKKYNDSEIVDYHKEYESTYFQKAFNQLNLSYLPIKPFKTKLSENEIINRLGGGDKTNGSCTSLAFAYVGNKIGLDVLDFRGGESLSFFSTNLTIQEVAKLKGVKGFIVRNTNDYKAISELIKNVKENKEYILTTGKHTSIIKKQNGKFYYLELQDPDKTNNTFKILNNEVLKKRFYCVKTNSFYGKKTEMANILIDCETLGKNKDFKRMLGFINTKEQNQKKGVDGSVK